MFEKSLIGIMSFDWHQLNSLIISQ